MAGEVVSHHLKLAWSPALLCLVTKLCVIEAQPIGAHLGWMADYIYIGTLLVGLSHIVSYLCIPLDVLELHVSQCVLIAGGILL